MNARARLLLLGIDAASAPLVERWTRAGTMPRLRRLMDHGTTGRTRGIESFFVGSTWPSLYTGTGPARHGVHYQLQIVPGTYRLHWCADAAFVRTDPFWTVLSAAGRRVAVLDVPLSRLGPVNGIQVVEWGGHDCLYGFGTSPVSLGSEIRARYGEHPADPSCDARRETIEDWRAFVDRLEAGVTRKAALTRDLLARGGWDCFVQVFTEAHCAGHQCWHLHDATHPAHDPAIAAAVGDPLRRIYAAVDAAIGEILDAAGETTVVVFSAHGMSYWYGAQFMLPEILHRLGVTVPAVPDRRDDIGALPRRVAHTVWRHLPDGVKIPVRAVRDRLRAGQVQAAPRIPSIAADVQRSRCFPLNNGLAVGGIRLNLAGREPAGLLEPGEEAEGFCRRLAADLLAILDERTGEPLVRRVRRTAELHRGEHLDDLPDLLVEWSDATPTGTTALAGGAGASIRASSAAIGTIEAANEYGRTGEHRAGGWFVVAGPGVPRATLANEVSLLDLAPTFTALLGVAMPDCDGRPIAALATAPRV